MYLQECALKKETATAVAQVKLLGNVNIISAG